MPRDAYLSKVTHPLPKGGLWTRGISVAESEIDREMARVGRWSNAPGPRLEGIESLEEPLLQGMAA